MFTGEVMRLLERTLGSGAMSGDTGAALIQSRRAAARPMSSRRRSAAATARYVQTIRLWSGGPWNLGAGPAAEAVNADGAGARSMALEVAAGGVVSAMSEGVGSMAGACRTAGAGTGAAACRARMGRVGMGRFQPKRAGTARMSSGIARDARRTSVHAALRTGTLRTRRMPR